ncbi:MAG: HAMP domain-containing sensor histidine kinase [Candidatus Melainabacteria bacterium]|nr:HAMP domain-containing sensor histidine kinase [Candidatus Melainabacteria bacterium]
MKFFNWTLTFQFVVLALLVYIALTSLSLFLFKGGLNEALDDQLNSLLAEQSQLIEFNGKNLNWLAGDSSGFHSQFVRPQASYQLFDSTGKILGSHGSYHCATLFIKSQEIRGEPLTYRSKSLPLIIGDKEVGYLQVELPTTQRDELMLKYAITICGVTLLGFGLLSVAGYNYSKEAAKPIFDSYEMLKQFSTDVAHELNTPISTIRATAENMSEELSEPEALKTRLEVINRALDRMNVIVKDLMLLTRLGMESEKPTREAEQIDLRKLVNDVVDEFKDRFQQKSIALRSKIEGSPMVMGHQDPLHRMLANLLENALRYTDAEGEVHVDLFTDHNIATITVSDTGIGIPEESVPKIFDRFYRVDKARTRDQGGSGLGLSIVKAIGTMHNAEIDVESEIGKGTKFIVSVPVAKSKS